MARAALLFFLLLFAEAAFSADSGISNVTNSVDSLCSGLQSTLPMLAMLMVFFAVAVYAMGQMMGSETRARANVWAAAAMIGAVISIVIVVISPPLLSVISSSPVMCKASGAPMIVSSCPSGQSICGNACCTLDSEYCGNGVCKPLSASNNITADETCGMEDGCLCVCIDGGGEKTTHLCSMNRVCECSPAQCASCQTGKIECGTACCNAATEACRSGACEPLGGSCSAGQISCGSNCCNSTTEKCDAGVCEPKQGGCYSGWITCGNGCCNPDTQFCGGGVCKPIVYDVIYAGEICNENAGCTCACNDGTTQLCSVSKVCTCSPAQCIIDCPAGQNACGARCCAFTETCNGGVCRPFSNGCTNTQFECGNTCCDSATEKCETGACQPRQQGGCAAGQFSCGNGCCNSATQYCDSGICKSNAAGCPTGQTECGSNCCTSGMDCVAGVCTTAAQSTCGGATSGSCSGSQSCYPGSHCPVGDYYCSLIAPGAPACCTAGQQCTAADTCCGGGTCTNGICVVPCAAAGESCANNTCCSGYSCIDGTCQVPCEGQSQGACPSTPRGNACHIGGNCPTTFYCSTRNMGAANRCCLEGETCNQYDFCCDGTCTNGVCVKPCANAFESCETNQCCTGLTCMPWGICLNMGGCFLPGTLVQTPSGGIPIEEVSIGDSVYSYSEDGKVSVSVVSAKYVASRDAYYTIKAGEYEVNASAEHPFLTPGGYKQASGLAVGDAIFVYQNGVLSGKMVTSVSRTNAPATVYNLQVDGDHTFFANGFAVHNKRT